MNLNDIGAMVSLDAFNAFLIATFVFMAIAMIVTLAFAAISYWFIPTVKP
jgi:hypothetical protein